MIITYFIGEYFELERYIHGRQNKEFITLFDLLGFFLVFGGFPIKKMRAGGPNWAPVRALQKGTEPHKTPHTITPYKSKLTKLN